MRPRLERPLRGERRCAGSGSRSPRARADTAGRERGGQHPGRRSRPTAAPRTFRVNGDREGCARRAAESRIADPFRLDGRRSAGRPRGRSRRRTVCGVRPQRRASSRRRPRGTSALSPGPDHAVTGTADTTRIQRAQGLAVPPCFDVQTSGDRVETSHMVASPALAIREVISGGE